MSKRSAFTVAGGLVAAILAVVVALSTLGLARTTTPASATAAQVQKPIVKTITKTITIHKKASTKAVDRSAAAPVVAAQSSWSEDSHGEGELDDSRGHGSGDDSGHSGDGSGHGSGHGGGDDD